MKVTANQGYPQTAVLCGNVRKIDRRDSRQMSGRTIVLVTSSLVAASVLAVSCGSPSTGPGAFNAKWVGTIGAYGPASGQLTYPLGVAVNSSAIVVSDQPTSRIEMFSLDGTSAKSWGSFGAGRGEMWAPVGVAIDSQSRTYVADVYNSRIQVFSKDGTPESAVGTKGSGADNLMYPYGVAVDRSGNLFVTDTGNRRVQKITATGVFDTQFAARQSNIDWAFPNGIAVAPDGHLWITDSQKNRVRELSPTGDLLLEWGEAGEAPGQMRSPQGIAVDDRYHVYVADCVNDRVDVFSSSGSFLGMWDGKGTPAPYPLVTPGSVAVLREGQNVRLFVTNSDDSVVYSLEVQW